MTVFGLYVRVFFVVALGAITWVTLDMVKKIKTERAAEEAAAERKAQEVLDSIPSLHAPPVPPVPDPPASPPGPPEESYPDRTAARSPLPMPVASIPPPSSYQVSGRVFDLRSLRPVPNAVLEFSAEGRPMRARTDAGGRYTVHLTRGRPHYVSFELSGYARASMHEPDVPYKSLSGAERERLIQAAASDDVARTAIVEDGESPLRLDVYVAPLD